MHLNNFPQSNQAIPGPKKLSEMIDIAEKLSNNIDFVRVDLYNPTPEKIYVGELTNYPMGGTQRFEPKTWNSELGKRLSLD